MVVPSAKLRRIIFFAGLALIAFGGIGLAFHAPWGDFFNSLFTVSGTTMSFAQFALGFNTLKPANTPPVSPQPSPEVHSAKAMLIAPSDQIPLEVTQLGIGRAPDNQHVIHDPQASGYHAIIHPRGEGYTITDLGSTNGTYVNGQRLIANIPCSLNPGDTIRIGTTAFTYQMKSSPEIAKTIPATEPHYPQATPAPAYGATSNAGYAGYAAYAPPPPSPAYAAAPMYAPPPPIYAAAPYKSATSAIKSFRRSGIALLLTAGSYLVQVLLLLGPQSPDTGQSIASFEILTYIFLLCALRGLHARQENKTGWLGTIGIMMLTAGAIINVLIGCIYVGNYVPGHSFAQTVSSTIAMLSYVNLIFLVFGDILYGLSIIRANVYPRWTGIILVIVGFLNLVALVPQAETQRSISLLAIILLIVFLTRLGLILIKQPTSQYQQQYMH